LFIDKLLKLWYNRNSVRLGRGRTAQKSPTLTLFAEAGSVGKNSI
jgi:hypothetical protein